MPMHAFTRLTVESRDRHRFFYFRHMARLAGIYLWIGAVQPFLKRHLLWKIADLFPTRPPRCGDERMAASAQRCVANLTSLDREKASRGRLHDALVTGIHRKRPVLRPDTVVFAVLRTGDHHVAVECCASA